MVNADPQGPKFHIEAFDPGEMRPEHRSFLYCSGFLITRTYCLHAHLRSARSLQITNKVFSDSQGALLQGWHVESQVPEDEEDVAPAEGAQGGARRWRRGFWNAERTWEGTGPKPGDINEVVRRHLQQKEIQPPAPRAIQSDLERSLSATALRLRNNSAKKRRQDRHLRGRPIDSSSASSSSSSSSSNTESAD